MRIIRCLDTYLSRFAGARGFSMLEASVALGIFGITTLILASTIKMTGVMSVTSDRQIEEGQLIFDANVALTSSQLCSTFLGGIVLPVQGSPTPIPIPSPTTTAIELSLSKNCVVQQPSSAPSPLAPGQYTSAGICRGGVYGGKINIDNVMLTNIQQMGTGTNAYSANVNITGKKFAAEIYGTGVVNQNLQVYFSLDPVTNTIASCQGAITTDSQANCQALGCLWTSSSTCDCCTPLGGTPTPTPGPTMCIFSENGCDLPVNYTWQVGNYTCATSTTTEIMPGFEAVVHSGATSLGAGQITVACCSAAGAPIASCTAAGTYVVDTTLPPTCNYPTCVTSTAATTTWGATCSGPTATLAAGTTGTVTDTSGTGGLASFWCPMANSGGVAQVLQSTCGVAPPPGCSGATTVTSTGPGSCTLPAAANAAVGSSASGLCSDGATICSVTCNAGPAWAATSPTACPAPPSCTVNLIYAGGVPNPSYPATDPAGADCNATFGNPNPGGLSCSINGLSCGEITGQLACPTSGPMPSSPNGRCEMVSVFACVCSSDIRLKKDIMWLGRENGFNIYEFAYRDDVPGLRGGGRRYIGVMAQEVLVTNPEAVVQMPNGYLAVRYDMIGVKFRRASTPSCHL